MASTVPAISLTRLWLPIVVLPFVTTEAVRAQPLTMLDWFLCVRQLRLLIAAGKTNVGLFQSAMPADDTLAARSTRGFRQVPLQGRLCNI
jgi:hypothetical protein